MYKYKVKFYLDYTKVICATSPKEAELLANKYAPIYGHVVFIKYIGLSR